MSDKLPPLDPELRALLDEEAARPDPTALAKAEVKRALMTSLAAGGVAAAAHSSNASGGAVAAGGAAAKAGTVLGVKLVPLALAFALGTGTGAAIYAKVAPEPAPRVETVIKEVRVPVPAPVLAPVVQPPPEPVAAPDAAVAAPLPAEPVRVAPKQAPAAREDAPSRDAALAEETALIARAQTALARGAQRGAIEALRLHESRYPRGQMVEEREALWIQALADSGDRPAAEARAKAFERRFPGSPLRAVVVRALEKAP